MKGSMHKGKKKLIKKPYKVEQGKHISFVTKTRKIYSA